MKKGLLQLSKTELLYLSEMKRKRNKEKTKGEEAEGAGPRPFWKGDWSK